MIIKSPKLPVRISGRKPARRREELGYRRRAVCFKDSEFPNHWTRCRPIRRASRLR